MIEPAQDYMADFQQAGRHPVIVLSREDLNRGTYTLVVFASQSEQVLPFGDPKCTVEAFSC